MVPFADLSDSVLGVKCFYCEFLIISLKKVYIFSTKPYYDLFVTKVALLVSQVVYYQGSIVYFMFGYGENTLMGEWSMESMNSMFHYFYLHL